VAGGWRPASCVLASERASPGLPPLSLKEAVFCFLRRLLAALLSVECDGALSFSNAKLFVVVDMMSTFLAHT
jgi:hypothetical protein